MGDSDQQTDLAAKASHHSASGDSGLLADLGLVSASDKGGKKDSDQEKDASYEEVFSDASGAEKKAAPGKAHWPASRSDYVPPGPCLPVVGRRLLHNRMV